MAKQVRTAFIAVVASTVILAFIYHKSIISGEYRQGSSAVPPVFQAHANFLIQEEDKHTAAHTSTRHVISIPNQFSTASVLLPAWEVLVVVSPEMPLQLESVAASNYTCLFPSGDSSIARPAGILSSSNRTTFKCELPVRLRRRLPFPQPILKVSNETLPPGAPTPELLRWNFLVFESLSTEKDVVLFVKGINNRQGVNHAPSQFRCVFGDDAVNGVKTAVTASSQEVFRCQHPDLMAVTASPSAGVKISLEITGENWIVPSVAYYTPARPRMPPRQPKPLICACTMVYNAAKFLKEWVVYHSAIGVERFILYDNDSDDNLYRVVEELVKEGYDLSTLLWLWPKTQEAGFSHCAINAKDTCTWMMYIDVDEFVYSPSWIDSPNPSKTMLNSLLPKSSSSSIGQVTINCYEFGPSKQVSHPELGVIQGYNCRRRSENRHKSIVLLDAVDESFTNAIHHFWLREGYRAKRLGLQKAVVNHYKYQAWPEFKAKFRRRVSAYVVDWTREQNLASKDRTPGLGYSPVEPKGWAEMFCEVHDDRLRELTRRWFGIESPSGYLTDWLR
ncbi:hypothetical protein NMG60_11015989 [Bertholletia excelsa]